MALKKISSSDLIKPKFCITLDQEKIKSQLMFLGYYVSSTEYGLEFIKYKYIGNYDYLHVTFFMNGQHEIMQSTKIEKLKP